MAESQDLNSESVRSLRIRWASDEGLTTRYANQAYISHAGDEFYLVFGEVAPPSITDEMSIDDLPEYIDIEPVVRLAIAPEAMLRMADAINKNVSSYKAQFGIVEDD